MGITNDDSGSGLSVSTGSITLDPGDLFAKRYRLEERLGEGAFGVVYRATQTEIGREVALKILHPDLLRSVGNVKRFVREAQLAQRLEHPNTVKLYDVGQTEDGLPFIAFQMLRGRPLDEVLKDDGPMSSRRVTRIATQVLKSLMEAHEQGIIHRDIKPPNIFLSDFPGEPDFVTVLDFGIAKPIAKEGDVASTALTAHGMPIGTPAYMAPEQVKGEDTIGPYTDLYALGLVMAELLTGEIVVRGPSLLDVCLVQASENPAPLPSVVLTSPLSEVIQKATQKNRARRYRHAREMFDDLESVAGATSAEQFDLPVVGPSASGAFGYAAPQNGSHQAQRTEPATYPPSLGGASGPALHYQPAAPADVAPKQEEQPPASPWDSKRLLVALAFGAGVLFLFLVTGIVVAVGVVLNRSEPSVSTPAQGPVPADFPMEGTQAPERRADPVILPAGDGTKLGALTTDMIRQRIESTGWQVHYVSEVGGQGRGQGFSFMIKKGRGSGNVSLLLFESRSLQLGSRTISPNTTVVMQGQRVLEVEVAQNGDPTVRPDAAKVLSQAIIQ